MGHNLFWGMIIIWVSIDVFLLVFYNQKKGKQKVERRSKFIIIGLILFGIFGGGYLAPNSTEAFEQPFQNWRYFSIILILIGVSIRVLAVLQLGKAFSVNLSVSEDGLYKKGLYRLIRHPSYLGEIIAFAGIAVAFNHPVSSVMAFLLPFMAFSYRIHLEEKMLLAEIGPDYEVYVQNTKKLVPYLY